MGDVYVFSLRNRLLFPDRPQECPSFSSDDHLIDVEAASYFIRRSWYLERRAFFVELEPLRPNEIKILARCPGFGGQKTHC